MKAEAAVAPAGHGLSQKEEFERLDCEIGELSAHIASAQARLLSMVSELESKVGTPDGARSTAHWLAWRCSMTPKAARDHVRVARGLAELSMIACAFEKGELSYHQVAILTRVATPQNEADLLDLARRATASQLDRAVRAYCRYVELKEANEQHSRRYLDFYFDDDGTLVIRGRLAPDDGAVVAKALEVSRQHIGFVPDPANPCDPRAPCIGRRPRLDQLRPGGSTRPLHHHPAVVRRPDGPDLDRRRPDLLGRQFLSDALKRLAAGEAGVGIVPPGY